jgi:hypothetical protein
MASRASPSASHAQKKKNKENKDIAKSTLQVYLILLYILKAAAGQNDCKIYFCQ